MTPDEKLVEALVAFKGAYLPDYVGAVHDAAREFIAIYRLVQLPEEADAWQVEWIEHEPGRDPWMSEPSREVAERVVRDPFYHDATTGRVRPVYTHYGDPVDVRADDE